jgi:hypothetical protein
VRTRGRYWVKVLGKNSSWTPSATLLIRREPGIHKTRISTAERLEQNVDIRGATALTASAVSIIFRQAAVTHFGKKPHRQIEAFCQSGTCTLEGNNSTMVPTKISHSRRIPFFLRETERSKTARIY